MLDLEATKRRLRDHQCGKGGVTAGDLLTWDLPLAIEELEAARRGPDLKLLNLVNELRVRDEDAREAKAENEMLRREIRDLRNELNAARIQLGEATRIIETAVDGAYVMEHTDLYADMVDFLEPEDKLDEQYERLQALKAKRAAVPAEPAAETIRLIDGGD